MQCCLLALAMPKEDVDPAKVVPALALVLLVGFVLAMLFLLSTYVLVRSMRRQRAAASRRRRAPTPTDDVWSMSRLPDDADTDDEDLEEPDR